MAPYIPEIIIILGIICSFAPKDLSPLLTVPCRWREWRLLLILSENEMYATFFLWFRHPNKCFHKEVVNSAAADVEEACPRKVYFLPLCTTSLSISIAEVRLQSAPLSVSCGAGRGLGDDPRNIRENQWALEEKMWVIHLFPLMFKGMEVETGVKGMKILSSKAE